MGLLALRYWLGIEKEVRLWNNKGVYVMYIWIGDDVYSAIVLYPEVDNA